MRPDLRSRSDIRLSLILALVATVILFALVGVTALALAELIQIRRLS